MSRSHPVAIRCRFRHPAQVLALAVFQQYKYSLPPPHSLYHPACLASWLTRGGLEAEEGHLPAITLAEEAEEAVLGVLFSPSRRERLSPSPLELEAQHRKVGEQVVLVD